jgi:hypothetical protein
MSTTAATRGGDSEGCACVNGKVFIVQIVGANEIILRYVKDVCHGWTGRPYIRRSICPSWQPGHQENMSWSCVRTLACAAKKVCIAWRSGLLGIRYDLNHGNYSKGVKLREWTSRMSLTCVTSSKKWELMAKTFLPNSGVASTYYFVHDSLYIGTHRWKQCAPRWGSS